MAAHKPNKTTETDNSVTAYLAGISNEKKRTDCMELSRLMSKQTGLTAKMWGTAIVGFGSYHYKYESGREGDAPLAGFAARTNAIVLYLALDADNRENLLSKFGKHKTGKGCIYIQKLEDIDTKVLAAMVDNSLKHMREKYPSS